ncbi:MAG: hypothetical protein NVS2B12_13010 [Ktedonobacteraceae bacterium]
MRTTRKILSFILIVTVIIFWFFLPSSDLNFPYFYCLGFFSLIAALFIYPVQSIPARPWTHDSIQNTMKDKPHETSNKS